MNAIVTKGLTKRYGQVTAVDDLNLTIPRGILYSLLGVNGAGKTTAMRLLCGLTAPTAGEATVMGHAVLSDTAGVRACIGLSPQETAVAPGLTVEENLHLMAGVHSLSKATATDRISELYNTLDLIPVAGRKADTLSGGWQRRLSIAMALVGNPAVLFLDEPTLGLDVLARRELWGTVAALKGHTTVLLTTHYMEEAEALSDRVGIMAAGRLVAEDTVDGLKARAATGSFEEAFVRFVKGDAQ